MQLFYNPEISINTSTISFDKEESRHISKVLRRKNGDILKITDGKGFIYDAKIIEDTIKACKVEIVSHKFEENHPYKLHLAVAPTKMNDRYEWFLEKATEIGIDSITPIFCDNSERKSIKSDRFERIIQSAVKQSLQAYMPQLNEAISFNDFVNERSEGRLLIAHCEETNKQNLKDVINRNEEVTILIGPEGDFSPDEIKLALSKEFIPVSLGDTRLRTETAAIVACQSVAFVNQ
ncbi:16S rRNA (uracil1498-N3)-methyltransferase [Flavobacteriaceae bacterium MAR_2010_188]|nr:16S rRNA (uracil1498-N3)-methyltransferase [Flavobacteriaceae bacterium MAR_2010_188]